MRRQLRHQLRNIRFAGSIHQILESKAGRYVNSSIRDASASHLILPHRMAHHRVDVDAVENPMELLGRKRHHGRLPTGPSEPVFCQSLQHHHKTGSIEEQELHPVTATVAKGKDRWRKRIQLHILLDQDSKAVDPSPEVDGLAMQVDLEISA
ncbi:hypothetical protein OU993_26700 [Rhizobium sp. SL86]|nr:hypothetical protein [Rhizobium sp. SL86]MCY1669017.1 hypothetical protein [Rhizobium sp. SL86]